MSLCAQFLLYFANEDQTCAFLAPYKKKSLIVKKRVTKLIVKLQYKIEYSSPWRQQSVATGCQDELVFTCKLINITTWLGQVLRNNGVACNKKTYNPQLPWYYI